MNFGALVRRGLWHHRKRHLGVLLGSAVAAAVLVGALAVGDSVRASLRAQALARIGAVDAALYSGDRLFRDDLASELTELVRPAHAALELAPVLLLEGVAALPSGERRANEVQVLGVDGRFLGLAGYGGPGPEARGVLLSERLAQQLELAAGDTLVVRVEPPSAVPRDMVLSTTDDLSLALRVEVTGVLPDEHLGRFELTAGSLPPFSIFVDLGWLQLQVEAEGRANAILAGGPGDPAAITAALETAVRAGWTLEDGELELRPVGPELELRTRRVFLDPPVAAAEALAGGTRILTYFVNELRIGAVASPYSMVAAVDASAGSELGALLPADLADDEIVINDWLASALGGALGDEQGAGPGDALTLRYYALGPNRRLVEAQADFRVRAVVPLSGAAADPGLMPDFPGLHDAEHCRDWETGVPIELDAVGDEDEAYWDEHRGTPKAFVTLAAGERLWGNRFGVLTAVRVPAAGSGGAAGGAEGLRARLQAELDPAVFGLSFRDVRTPALRASSPVTDFGGLFLGLSFFLLGAALLLTALLFAFGVEARAAEIGTLASIGFPPARIRRLFLLEGGVFALLGGLLGGALGLVYTRAVLAGLATVWRGAVGGTVLSFHASPISVLGGVLAAFVCALAAMHFALRGQARRPAAELVRSAGGLTSTTVLGARKRVRTAAAVALIALLGALAIAFNAPAGAGASGAFFGAGALVLIGGLAAARIALARRVSSGVGSLRALGAGNAARRPGRSLATVALLACGSFLVLSVGVHHRGTEARPFERSAGTGGFALFARSSLPVLFDLNAAEGREAFGLEEEDLEGASVLALRVRAGDDASCLQLGVPQEPELLGVDPAELQARGAFTFAGTLEETDAPWLLLSSPADGAVPAIADHASATWTMKKKLGETFEYLDELGRPFQVRLVGTLQGSLLQGSLIISARDFEARFPSAGGYQTFLIDAPEERAEEVGAALSSALSDVGLEVTPAARRLAQFNEVQNTYLVVFQLLGGLGLLLGSAGLGLVVLRNALERRAELAVLRAVGFTRGAVRRLLFSEHVGLFAAGLGIGALAAAVAWVPVASGGASEIPTSVPVLLALLALSGYVWVSWAASVAVRGPLIDALRDE